MMQNRLGNNYNIISGQIIRQSNNELIIPDRQNIKVTNLNLRNTNCVSFTATPGSVLGKGADFVTDIVGKIQSGGHFMEFCLVDLLGMWIPRIYQNLMRNREELGHLNYKAGIEETIRELLTGPSMFIIPLCMLAASGKVFGPASKVRFDMADKFNDTFSKICRGSKDTLGSPEQLKTSFYDSMISQAFEPFKGQPGLADEKEEIIRQLKRLESKPNYRKGIAGYFESLNYFGKANADHRNTLKDAFGKITEIFSRLNKRSGNLTEGIEKSAELGFEVKLGEYRRPLDKFISEIVQFGTDVPATVSRGIFEKKQNVEDALKNAFARVKGGRIITLTLGIVSTGVFLYCIPLFYKRFKSFPGTEGLKDNTNPRSISVSQPAQNQNIPRLSAKDYFNMIHGGKGL